MSLATTTSPEKEQRRKRIQDELDVILDASHTYCQEYLEEEEMESEAGVAITKSAYELAYRKKYYDVLKDEIIYFPSVAKLIITNTLQDQAEEYYYDDEDEFPLEYSKCLKTVCKDQGLVKESLGDDDENEENDAYMEKLAQDVEI